MEDNREGTLDTFLRYCNYDPVKVMKNANAVDALELHFFIQKLEGPKLRIVKELKGKCTKCGWCCKSEHCMVLPEDILKLTRYLKITKEQFYYKYMDKTAEIPSYLKIPCPFYEEGYGCKVYSQRPIICRLFPFSDLFLVVEPCNVGAEILKILKDAGIVINEGPTEDDKKLLQIVDFTNAMLPKGEKIQSKIIGIDIMMIDIIINKLKKGGD